MNKKYAELDFPAWFDGKDVNEAAFCREFLSKNKLIYADNAFFTPDGRLTDPLLLKEKIYAELECCAAKNIPRTISNSTCIHFANFRFNPLFPYGKRRMCPTSICNKIALFQSTLPIREETRWSGCL